MRILSTWTVQDGVVFAGASQSSDLTGKRFGRLVVVGRAPNPPYQPRSSSVFWRCQCDCGEIIVSNVENLRSRRSCGCALAPRARSLATRRRLRRQARTMATAKGKLRRRRKAA